MSFQIFPNWSKKIGLGFFITASLINGGVNFFKTPKTIQGIDATSLNILNENGFRALLNVFSGGALMNSINIFAIVGMIIYILSKEKIEDDYINKLRLEAYQLTTVVGLLIVVSLFFLSKELKLTLDYIIYPFLWFYIGVFFIKRRLYL